MMVKTSSTTFTTKSWGDGVDKKVTVAVMDFDPRGITCGSTYFNR